jgi:hypothetical protein
MVPQTAFAGASYFTMATLDLCQLETMVNLVEKETGLHANAYTVEIVSNIAFAANASGQAVADTFEPVLAFKYDKVHLYLANTNEEVDPMHTAKQGLAGSANFKANTLSVFGWAPTIRSVRTFSLLGLGISLVSFLTVLIFIFNTVRQSEETSIQMRYGSILMDVYEQSLDAGLPIINVTSIDDLAKMAERQNTMIMHMKVDLLPCYLVQGNGVIYRYGNSFANSEVPAKTQESIRKQTVEPRKLQSQHRRPAILKPMEAMEQKKAEPIQQTAAPVVRQEQRTPEILKPTEHGVKESIQQSFEPVVKQQPRSPEILRPVLQETTEYIIKPGNISFEPSYFEETEMLRKIRI